MRNRIQKLRLQVTKYRMVATLLWLFFTPLITKAQTDSTGVKEKSRNVFTIVRDLVVEYLDYYDYDTAYIRPPKFYYTLMMQESANFEQYTLRSLGEKRPTSDGTDSF